MRKAIVALAVAFAVLAALMLVGCESTHKSTEQRQQEAQKQSFANVVEDEPPYVMSHSPSRETANFWAKTWDDPNKPAYIYLFDSVGHKIMYFVIKGPPVSYCASTISPQKLVHGDVGDYYGDFVMPAPAQDGMYYVNANCQQMYGEDFLTGKYVEWTGGGSFNYIMTEDPLTDPHFQDFPQGGPTSLEQAKKKQ